MIYRKQILNEDLDREFNRDALYFSYVVIKNKRVIEYLPEKQEERCKSV